MLGEAIESANLVEQQCVECRSWKEKKLRKGAREIYMEVSRQTCIGSIWQMMKVEGESQCVMALT